MCAASSPPSLCLDMGALRAHTCTHMHTCRHTRRCTHRCTHTCRCTHAQANTHTYTCGHTCTHVDAQAHTHEYTLCRHTGTHTCMDMYTHTHRCVQTSSSSRPCYSQEQHSDPEASLTVASEGPVFTSPCGGDGAPMHALCPSVLSEAILSSAPVTFPASVPPFLEPGHGRWSFPEWESRVLCLLPCLLLVALKCASLGPASCFHMEMTQAALPPLLAP